MSIGTCIVKCCRTVFILGVDIEAFTDHLLQNVDFIVSRYCIDWKTKSYQRREILARYPFEEWNCAFYSGIVLV